ncbi:MAG: hypothetical protein H7255_09040 [Ramlibacter sp.]|nr:hypothetical protein [Ramlibacter sp.]
MKVRWLDRDTVLAPHMTLCLNEQQFLAAAKHCKLKRPDQWLDVAKQKACVHTWEANDKLTCVVCLHPDSIKSDPIDVACMLVHEAVHVFQRLCDSIGEHTPGREFEAYSVERIAEQLMRDFVKQTVPKRDAARA